MWHRLAVALTIAVIVLPPAALLSAADVAIPDDYYSSYAAKVQATTLADVAAASGVIQPDRLVWVIAGDRAKIEPGLRELGLGEIRAIDADGNVK